MTASNSGGTALPDGGRDVRSSGGGTGPLDGPSAAAATPGGVALLAFGDVALLPFGDAAVLVRVGDGALTSRLARVRAWDAAIRALALPGIEDVVPAEGSVLVRLDPRLLTLAALRERLTGLAPQPVPGGSGPLVELPVTYDGPDLDDVARLTGLSPDEVVAAHQGSAWTVGFCGFAPGFGYLVGGDPRLRVPRRDAPRTAVPTGAVGLAGDYCGVYPRSSPGGWQLIARLAGGPPLWDADREPAALLAPGTRVRFVPLGLGVQPATASAGPILAEQLYADLGDAEHALADPGLAGRALTDLGPAGRALTDQVTPPGRQAATPSPSEPTLLADGALEVLTPGPLTTIQDLGRPGLAHLGVPRSGTADRSALIAANRLLGNAPGAAGLEVTLGGLALRALRELALCVTGADLDITVDGVLHPRDAVLTVGSGQVLRLGTARAGIRAVVAVRGGLRVPPVLGSAATDRLSGLGPAPLAAGDRLVVGVPEGPIAARVLARDAPPSPAAILELAVLPGPDAVPLGASPAAVPHDGDRGPDAVRGPAADAGATADPTKADLGHLLGRLWRVAPESDRIGVRLQPVDGEAPPGGRGTRPSEGLVRGAVQLPPSGLPVIFLADHPTTGGYPVVACLTTAAADLLAQARPGQRLRFTPARA